MAEQALSGIRVIDLTHYISGPVSTKLLADYGADVIKIERPGAGDKARSIGPFYHDEPNLEKSGLFLYLNTNKRGITLNLKSVLGKEILLEMVKRADVVVENFKPGTMERLGLSYEELEKINPRLVMTSISNFGQTGPYRDYKLTELMAFGMGGPMYSMGQAEREPIKYAWTPSIYQSGVVAAMATVVAFYGMRRHGIGEHVDVSIMETQAGTIDRRQQAQVTYQYTGRVTPRGAILGQAIASGMFPCADGYVLFIAGGPRLDRVSAMMGNPPEVMDPKFYTPLAQRDPELREEYNAVFLGWCMEHTKHEIFEIGQEFKNICAPMYTIDEVFEDPHIKYRDFMVEIDHPITGKLKYPGRPFIMGETPWVLRRPAPTLGQHNQEVYSELGYAREDVVKLREIGVI
ncbi:MAG: CoA transferase [Chloroflexota bacterium]